MDKVKDKLHIGSKRKEEKAAALAADNGDAADQDFGHHRDSYDSELDAMSPEERVRYLKEYEHAEKHGEPKKGSFLDRLISRGNKKTEEDLAAEAKLAEQAKIRQAAEGHVR